MARPLLVNVAELLREPGARKQISITVRAAELDLTDPRVEPDAEIRLDAVLESTLDGIVARGTLAVPWHDDCRRCTRPVAGTVQAPFDELFQTQLTDAEASPITGEQIDLHALVRDLALLETPSGAVCRPECAGLCPTCGADRNEGPCGCPSTTGDARWAALDVLRDQLR